MPSRCVQCGNPNLEVSYADCPLRSLASTTLKNMRNEKCWECGENYVAFPALGKLLQNLAYAVASKTTALTEEETTFLIKMLPDNLQERFNTLVRIQGYPLRIDSETELKEYLSEQAVPRVTPHPRYLQYGAEYKEKNWEIWVYRPIQ